MNRKTWILGIAVLVLLPILYFAFQWFKPHDRVRGIYLIPKDAIYVLESNSPVDSWHDFSKGTLWNEAKQYPAFFELAEEADALDQIISENKFLSSLAEDHHFMMSAHMIKPSEYDFLFAIDIGNKTQTNTAIKTVSNVAKSYDWLVTKRRFQDIEIMELYSNESRERIHFCLQENYLLISYSSALIEASILEFKEPFLGRNIQFQDVSDLVDLDGSFRLYVQYEKVPEYLGVFSNEWKSDPWKIGSSAAFTAFNTEIGDDELAINGFTNLQPKAAYLKALHQSGSSDMSLQHYLSNRTAYYIHLGFKDIDGFYHNVINQLSKDQGSKQTFDKYKKQIESLLKISLEKDLLGWIEDEVVLGQLEPHSHIRSEEDLVVLMKAKSHDVAHEKLGKVVSQIKKRTPAKFKSFEYKQHQIQYLAVKGVFSMFFGKAFDQISQPYFVIIDNVVVFSNQPKTLIGFLDDYENNRLLINQNSYKDFVASFEGDNTLFTYGNSGRSVGLIKSQLKGSERLEFTKHQLFFNFMDQVGFQMVKSGDVFKTDVMLTYNREKEDKSAIITSDSIDVLFNHYFTDISDQSMLGEEGKSQIRQFIKDGWYQRYYKGTEKLEIKAETDDGLFDGKYFEYHPNGERRVKGKYRNGKRVGKWRFYTSAGDEEKQIRY